MLKIFELKRKNVEVRNNLHGGEGIVAERRDPELASGLDSTTEGE